MNYKLFFRTYSSHYKPNFLLALPVIISHAGQMIVGLTDTIMVGQLGANELAAVSLANNIFLIGLVFGLGIAAGITPLTGKDFAGGNWLCATQWFKNGMIMLPAIGIVQAVLMAFIIFLMPFMGQPPEVVKFAIPYFLALVASYIPFMFFVVFQRYAEGLGNTRIAMTITISINVLNILLNYLLIYGKFGFPALGVLGAGVATFIARLLMPIIFAIIFFKSSFFRPDIINWRKCSLSINSIKNLFKIGFPVAGQNIVEVTTFTVGSIMAGWLGAAALAANQVVLSLSCFTYMVAGGFATAATIKVSHFRGQNKMKQAKDTVFATLHQVFLFMGMSVIFFILFRFKIPALFVPGDEEVLRIAAMLMLIAGLYQLFDGMQVVLLGALRGYEDVKIPMFIEIGVYFLFALPLCYVLAFVFKMGAAGIWTGYLAGLFLVSVLLLIRFNRINH